jgi:hypothetical protein
VTASPGEFNPTIDAKELVAVLQQQIGEYVVEKAATDLYVQKLQNHIAGLESQLTKVQMQVPDTAAE